MVRAESLIAGTIMVGSAVLMWHATILPIGWVEGEGPGGGAFPFWISGIMLLASAGIFWRSVTDAPAEPAPFFDPETLRAVLSVIAALTVTIGLMPVVGTYIALPLFICWYLKVMGRHGWTLTLILAIATPLFLFFFFEVTLKILLPKGFTEPYFFPLYAIFF